MSSKYRIHPAIGVARLGNSPEHFIGPETPGVPPNWNDAAQAFNSFRDAKGQILRQGARFHVYEYKPVEGGGFAAPSEVSIGGEVVSIEWRVHVANRKASFFSFFGQLGADDAYVARSKMPAATIIENDPDICNLRNSDVPAEKRSQLLEIDPGEKSISLTQPGPVELLNQNANIPIKSLGTLLLDESGRLIVLGGYGESNSTSNPPRQINEYASNDTWFDDAGDGSVKARIHFKDETFIDADPAWVLVGPPDFAPNVGNVVTLRDTVWDTGVRDVDFPNADILTPAQTVLREQKRIWNANAAKTLSGFTPSFVRDIYPLLSRALGARDVHVSGNSNQNYHTMTFGNWAELSALSGPLATPQAARRRSLTFQRLRNPDGSEVEWNAMPRGLGDFYTDLDNGKPVPKSFLTLTHVQYALVREWSLGNFIDDWPKTESPLTGKSSPTPDDLDLAASENSVGGPFYPGIDVSWLIRRPEIYSEPLRINYPALPDEEVKTPLLKIGALQFQPGFFSQQMALPWQADFYDCHKEPHDDPDGTPFEFMWWTAHRPDDVFPSGSQTRARWVREFDKHAKNPNDGDNLDNLERFHQMQSRWFELKFISVKNGDHYEEEP
jgi:L-Lysine epsilon oxidase N-terminal/L-lysine epsilon oxidase C-terminal domain